MTDIDKRPLKVFLCHASADKPKVRELYQYLKRRKIDAWLDEVNLLPGQDWDLEIYKATRGADAIIICLSKESVAKEGYVQKEIRRALDISEEKPDGTIFVIPLRLEECEVPIRLKKYQWVDLFDEGGYPKLIKSLKVRASQLKRASVKTPKPAEIEPEFIPNLELKQAKDKTQVDNQQDFRKFYNLLQHYECDVPDANAETVAKSLFEELTREKRFAEIPDRKNDNQIIRYDTDNRNIEYCDPKTGKTIQHALIINGTETKLLGKGSIGEWIPRSNVSLKNIPEMLIITVTQGINVSRLRFDSDKLPGDTFIQLVKGILLYLGIEYVPKPNTNKPPRKLKTEYIIAIIGAAATILAALIGILPQLIKPAPTLISTAIPTVTITPTIKATATLTPVPTLGIGSTWKRPADQMVMVYIPQGTFEMGSESGSTYEKPLHQVTLSSFWIDRNEVTNEMFVIFLNGVKAELTIHGKDVFQQQSKISTLQNRIVWDGVKFSLGDEQFSQHPAGLVSWLGASSYCEWAGAQLPTEAQWEFAARGTDGRTYPWGEGLDCLHANYLGCVGNTSQVMANPQGMSPFGVYDLAGNVWEWVNDRFSGNYYASSPLNDPHGPEQGTQWVIRGGAWNDSGGGLRAWFRDARSFDDPLLDTIGFRCSRSLP